MAALAAETRARVLKWTGIPVRVSVAETMTLAKAASEYARARLRAGEEPTVCFFGHPDREAWLEQMPVEDVWGVGRRWGQRLRCLGGSTAARLARLDDRLVRSRFNVVLLRTAYELRGVPCVRLDDAPTRRTMVRSRSFGEPVEDLETIRRAVATHAARAAEKLRAEGLVAGQVAAFVTTKGYGPGPHRSGWVERPLAVATSRTPDLIRAALLALEGAFADGTGRTLPVPEGGRRALGDPPGRDRAGGDVRRGRRRRRAVPGVDRGAGPAHGDGRPLNRRFGKRAVAFGSMGPPSALRRRGTGRTGLRGGRCGGTT